MILADDLLEGSRTHPHRERQAGPVGVGQAAAGYGRRTANSTAEEILAHFQRSYGYRPTPDRARAVLRRREGTLASKAIKKGA